MKLLSAGLAPLSILLATPAASAATQGMFISQSENVLGTSLTIKVVASSYAAAREAESVVFSEISRLTSLLSGFHSGSEFSRWLASEGQARAVSADLWNVLRLFDAWQEKTGGAINAAAEALNQLWHEAGKTQLAPSAETIQQVVAAVQQPHWSLTADGQTATRLTDTPLRLHTFTKSYILDKAALAAMALPDVHALVLNGGGDIVVRGNWAESVAVANPQDDAENSPALSRIRLENRAVATSGGYRRGVRVGDSWRSHLVDPRTGLPASDVASATVVHPDAVTAGALATAFSILSPTESAELAKTVAGTQYLIVASNGEQHSSPDWNHLTEPPVTENPPVGTVNLMSVSRKDKLWNSSQELLISLELPRFEGRSHRPFVAIWVEDDARKPVRQIALWYNKPRWLPELRAWYGLHTDDAASVTSATRSPGQYTLAWDGKDDQGQYVKQGKYTICIEAAREHGSYQLIRQEMDFNGKPKQQTLNGNVEISSAALDYRQKSDAR